MRLDKKIKSVLIKVGISIILAVFALLIFYPFRFTACADECLGEKECVMCHEYTSPIQEIIIVILIFTMLIFCLFYVAEFIYKKFRKKYAK